ncbi:VOC family protein [Ornithinimicrobium avium]|uniref:VOC family protein n=1 Tax=Ornithinimicrobium avium TaxID=2283195 RepID=A0A345NJG1_9MICO|nr:VOC family protein [Ornithinimicrobium avium]AXH95169.1 VOC family protein [Ornithinimicrobium avium]
MIIAVHTLVYSDDPPATRAFFKDVLRWPFVSEGARGGEGVVVDTGGTDPADWLIFGTGPSELGVHPTSWEEGGRPGGSPTHHQIALMVEDVAATVAELAGRGATFVDEPRDMGFGTGVEMHVPGADDMLLYQPQHVTAYDKA